MTFILIIVQEQLRFCKARCKMENFRITETEIFDIWRSRYGEIVTDGIVNEDEFANVLFLLKEANGGSSWDLTEFLRSGGRAATWNNIARWTEGILRINEEIRWTELEHITDAKRKTLLQKIAVVNVKKVAGGATANSDEIAKSVADNKDILLKQIELYKPTIIVCCGVGANLFDEKWEMTSRGIWYKKIDETVVIDYFHPQAHIKNYFLYYGLMDAIKEILKIDY